MQIQCESNRAATQLGSLTRKREGGSKLASSLEAGPDKVPARQHKLQDVLRLAKTLAVVFKYQTGYNIPSKS